MIAVEAHGCRSSTGDAAVVQGNIAAAVEAHGCRSSTGDAAVVQGGHCLRDSDCGRRFRSARAIDYRSHGGRFGLKLLSCAARCRGCVCHFAHRCRGLGEHTYPCSRVQAAKIAVVPFLSFGVIAATFLVRVHLPNCPLSTPQRRGFKRVQFRHGWFGRLVSEMIHFEWLMGGYLRLAMVWSYKLVKLSILIDKPSGNLIGNPLLYIRICSWWPKSTLRLCFEPAEANYSLCSFLIVTVLACCTKLVAVPEDQPVPDPTSVFCRAFDCFWLPACCFCVSRF